jgi:hypothetical protein
MLTRSKRKANESDKSAKPTKPKPVPKKKATKKSKSIPKHIKATKRSSVSIILRPTTSSSSTTATSFDILYLRRADYPGDPWSGQVCFSGGKRESIDQSDLETAVRETKEECQE